MTEQQSGPVRYSLFFSSAEKACQAHALLPGILGDVSPVWLAGPRICFLIRDMLPSETIQRFRQLDLEAYSFQCLPQEAISLPTTALAWSSLGELYRAFPELFGPDLRSWPQKRCCQEESQ